jgi:hypothetical protein
MDLFVAHKVRFYRKQRNLLRYPHPLLDALEHYCYYLYRATD